MASLFVVRLDHLREQFWQLIQEPWGAAICRWGVEEEFWWEEAGGNGRGRDGFVPPNADVKDRSMWKGMIWVNLEICYRSSAGFSTVCELCGHTEGPTFVRICGALIKPTSIGQLSFYVKNTFPAKMHQNAQICIFLLKKISGMTPPNPHTHSKGGAPSPYP
jgi:hypothetical protein